jgi:5-methylcytosine-specific restriction endonuclease McrA
MKFEDIKNKQDYECSECKKKLKKEDNIHFIGKPKLIGFDSEEDFSMDDEEIEVVCEECHNKMFGED